MNTLGLSLILKMGCFCAKEVVNINNVRYRVKERIAEGGFSTIDLIENIHSKQKYALKRITCYSIDDQKIALQEIEYYKQIHHPNIIELVDSMLKGSADIVINSTSDVYVILPFYYRGTLHNLLDLRSKSQTHLDLNEILNMFKQLCSAIKYLHDFHPQPLAHRDLKTANVCLADDFTPVLMDFVSASRNKRHLFLTAHTPPVLELFITGYYRGWKEPYNQQGSMTTAKVQVCGAQDAQKLQDLAAERCSMAYRAPELFNVESYCVIDQRTDIWSLGCVLYAICYYKSPFDAVYERGDSVALAVLSGKIALPKEDSLYPQDLHELITFMLEVNPEKRPFIDQVIEKTLQVCNVTQSRV